MKTFSIQTLGCKVNAYEGQQIAALLRRRGLVQVEEAGDLCIVHTCSVTTQAASKSRQMVKRGTRGPTSQHTIVTGCWATSHQEDAGKISGVSAVITHRDDVAAQLDRLLAGWQAQAEPTACPFAAGTRALPILDQRQFAYQRALLKIQDGCDAHCTYCIIPKLRSDLYSKPIAQTVQEAKNLIAAGHMEIVLTGIFLGAYGQPTAWHRRQDRSQRHPLATLLESLCTQVPGLRRIRLSSLEPGDVTPDLLAVMKSHPQIVPHLHLPLQSGSDAILRRMNRQYTADDFLRMLDAVHQTFDRPALTTDIIAGFPGEGEAEFAQTLAVARQANFIHMHAFAFSPRPGTAAARWKKDFVPGTTVNQRIALLSQLGDENSLAFRRQFLGDTVDVLVERETPENRKSPSAHFKSAICNLESGICNRQCPPMECRHGRCPRYFDVHFPADKKIHTGDLVAVRIDAVHPHRTQGTLLTKLSAS